MGHRCGPGGRFSAHFRPLSAENSQVSALSSPQVHDREPTRVDLIKKVAWWQCTNTGHALAPVGQLTAEIVKTL